MIGWLRKARWCRATIGAMAGMAIVIGSAQQSHANDDQDDDLPDVRFFRNLLKGFGLRRDGEASIDYRERAPLVLPPSRVLPAPERNTNSPAAADWPKDPDVERARQERAASRKRAPDPEELERPSTPAELNVRGGPRRTASRPDGRPSRSAEEAENPSSLSELGTKSIFSNVIGAKEEYATFKQEPARGRLTEPPPGYRTPSPNQPYGVGKEKWQPPSEAARHIPDR